jgi:apolipoprotein N-acyltransferase
VENDALSLTAIRPSLFAPTLGTLARRIAALAGWHRALLGFALGAISVLGFAPFNLWPLLFIVFPCLIWLFDGIAEDAATSAKPKWRQAALAGWWFGFGFFAAGLYWTGFAFFVEADKFAMLVPLAVLAFPAGLALFYALAGAAMMALWGPGTRRVFVLTAAFFAVDWLRGHILTGFPWNLWGYTLAGNDAIAQSASLFGVYGLSLLAPLIFSSPAALAGPHRRAGGRPWALPAICLALLALGWGWGAVRLATATDAMRSDMTLRIVQANVPQAEKWKPENRGWIFDRLTKLSKDGASEGGAATAKKPTLVIWPETSVPFLFMLNGAIASEEARQAFAELIPAGSTLILGAERVEGARRPDGRYNVDRVYNSLFILGSEARILGIYDKTHLVPFGEYVPFESVLSAVGITQLTHLNFGFASGAERRVMSAPGVPAFSPLICYEAIFPGRVIGEGGRPDWLLNATNDAWFGTSIGPYQHLSQARLRAIEEGLPLIRAANTGISAVIDAYGRTLASLPLNTIGTIDHALPVALEPTPYSRWGDNYLILVAFLISLLYRIVIEVE